MIFKGIYCSNTPAEIKMERIYMKIEGLKVHLLALSDICIMIYASTSLCFKEESLEVNQNAVVLHHLLGGRESRRKRKKLGEEGEGHCCH